MKFYVIVFLSVALPVVIGLPDELLELMATLHKTCVDEIGVDQALIDKVNNEKVFADDEKLKCYIKCIMDQTGTISDDGIVDEEAALSMMPEELKAEAEPVIKGCGTKVGSSPCENAWLTHKCYQETNNKYMLI